jgi:hypothetical protein
MTEPLAQPGIFGHFKTFVNFGFHAIAKIIDLPEPQF